MQFGFMENDYGKQNHVKLWKLSMEKITNQFARRDFIFLLLVKKTCNKV